MIIEVEETSRIHQDHEIEQIVERGHLGIIMIEIMIAKLVKHIPGKGKFLQNNNN